MSQGRGRRIGFAIVLMAGMTSQSLIFAPIAPALPGIAARAGTHGETVAQLCFALPSLGLILSGLLAGGIIDRFGPRGAIIWSLVLYVVTGTSPVLLDAPVPLLATRLLMGFATGIITTSATVLLVASYEGEARGRMLGYQSSTGSAVGLVALLVAGAIVQHADWHMAFLLYGGVMGIFLLLAIVCVPSIRPVREGASAGAGKAIVLLWPGYLAACLLFVIPASCGSQLAFLLRDRGTHDAFAQAVVIAMVNLGSMSSAAVFGRIEAACGPRRTFASSLAIGALGLLLIGVGPSAWVVGAGSLLSGIAVGLYFPYLWLVAATLPSPELRSKVLALQASAMYLGGFLYPAIFGGLSRGFGLEGAFVAMAVLMSFATAVVLLARSGRLLLVRAPG